MIVRADPAPTTTKSTVPSCDPKALLPWLADGPGGGALGTHGVHVTVTNLSGGRCAIYGTPHVIAVGVTGAQIGPAASTRSTETAKKVVLAARGSASFKFTYGTAVDYPKARCRPTMAAGIRVTLPGAKNSRLVPIPFEICSRRVAALYFSVGPID